MVLPMGKGRSSWCCRWPCLRTPERVRWCGTGALSCTSASRYRERNTLPGAMQATVDLGEIHLAAVTTNTGKALIVTGRGIRSLKRQRRRQLGQLAKKQSRCKKHSRRWKKLQRAKNKVCRRTERRVRDLQTQGHPAGHRLLCHAPSRDALHRQPARRSRPGQRAASQRSHGAVGVRQRHRLPHA